jgi:hypothetical protein
MTRSVGVRRWLSLLAIAAMLAPCAARADTQWKLMKRDGHPYLQGMSSEPEADTEFWALCRSGSAIDLGVGADAGVGNAKGETVRLTLTSGNATATLSGRSRNSANFEMTAGTELRATVAATDPVFIVLATGTPIRVIGSLKAPETWQVKGLKQQVAAFLAACR